MNPSGFSQAITDTLVEQRMFAEALMVATCRITKDGVGEPVFNETTGQYTYPDRVTVYEGPCRIQVKSVIASSSDSDAGERATTTQDVELQLPIAGTDDVAVGHQAEILTNPWDASLVDRVFTVAARNEKTHATARRLRVVEVTG